VGIFWTIRFSVSHIWPFCLSYPKEMDWTSRGKLLRNPGFASVKSTNTDGYCYPAVLVNSDSGFLKSTFDKTFLHILAKCHMFSKANSKCYERWEITSLELFKTVFYILNIAATPLRLWSTEHLTSNFRIKRITQFLKAELQILKKLCAIPSHFHSFNLKNFLYKQHTILYLVT
jgi:hypothetical protein